MSHTELKSVETKRNSLRTQTDNLRKEIQQLKVDALKEYNAGADDKALAIHKKKRTLILKLVELEHELSLIKKEKGNLGKKNGNLIITEHAVLRYIERVMGVDIEQVKKVMVPEKTKEQIAILKSGSFPVQDEDGSYKLQVRNMTIITVLN